MLALSTNYTCGLGLLKENHRTRVPREPRGHDETADTKLKRQRPRSSGHQQNDSLTVFALFDRETIDKCMNNSSGFKYRV